MPIPKAQTTPPPPKGSENSPDWASPDSQAKKEVEVWDRLEEARTRADTKWINWYGTVVVVGMVILALLFFVSIGIVAWHYLAPSNLHWLSEDQITKVQSIIFSGGVGAIISSIAQKHISK